MDRRKDPNSNSTEKRISKVQHPNRKKVRKQVELLSIDRDRNQEEPPQQARSKDRLEAARGHTLGPEKENGELGIRSIFYDKDWNQRGIAPPHYRNIPYNPETFKRRTEVQPRLGNLGNIKIPK
ncbi:Aim4p [Saccharomyces paradoxus]|uniref:Aim4p n=1 Tax=Saccharomyces paradoxus TaxID=27291 RepID=A0A8B8UMB4_SACPA|nr:Aim4 [Saccharomyces paradoxus]QHS71754.1 Aim4 [Saccharomyces paradoxus]